VGKLDGVTVEGKPIEEYIEDMQEKWGKGRKPKPDNEVRRQIKETIQEKRKCIPKFTYVPKEEETRKVSKQVRYYSHNEIRKEKGIMEKPFKTINENLLWLMVNKGPITVTEMEKELGKKPTHLSGPVFRIYKTLGMSMEADQNVVVRFQEGGRGSHKYHAVDDITAERLFQLYRIRTSPLSKKGKVCDWVKEESLEKRVSGGLKLDLKDNLNLNIKVSGKIDVVFSWKG